MMYFILLKIFFLSFPFTAFGLEEKSVEEIPCSFGSETGPPQAEIGLDFKWMGSVSEFYVPFLSKYYAARTASELLEKDVSVISPLEMTPSCLIMEKGNLVSGFGKKIQYNLTGDSTGLQFKAPWAGAMDARFRFHMTDNKSFILGVTCWSNGQSGWAVMSTTQFLEPPTREKVLKYVKQLGFQEKFALDEDFQNCGQHNPIFIRRNYICYPRSVFSNWN